MTEFPITERNRMRRQPKRARYERDVVYGIVDEALICHAAFVLDGTPVVVPLVHARMGDSVVLHGSKGARLIQHVEAGGEVCLTFTLLDGLVLARSAFHHSVNFRSAMLFGKGVSLESAEDKMEALKAVVEHIMPGRWDDVRRPNAQELDATAVVSIAIDTASAKVRTGPPEDAPEDYALGVWAGVLPLRQQASAPVADPRMESAIDLPDYLRRRVAG